MANFIKIADIVGIKEMLQNYYKALRNFFANKSEMDVVSIALTDLERRKIEASDIPTSLPANGGNADYATSAGNADKLDGKHASDFILKSEHAGDMYEVNDDGTDYCEAELKWQVLPNANPSTNYRFADMIQVPVPSKEVMEKLADCIKQVSTVTLKIGETVFNEPHEWKLIHWLLRCSNEDSIVYTTKYLTPDARFPSIDDDGTIKSPPPVIDISVCYGGGARYVHITIENEYGRAYYFSTNIQKISNI